MSEGYSYATVSSHPGRPARVDVALYLDGRARMETHVHQGGATAHLTVEMGDVSATVGPASPSRVTADDVRIARQFADEAAAYAAAVEQIAAASDEGPAAA